MHTSLFYGTELRLGQGLHLEIGTVGKSSQLWEQCKKSCPENQPADADKEGITQTWLLNLCPVSAFSTSFQGYSVQLLLPGLGSSNIQ